MSKKLVHLQNKILRFVEEQDAEDIDKAVLEAFVQGENINPNEILLTLVRYILART
jgi:hypothetical protein